MAGSVVTPQRRVGRPRVGDCRLETIIPQAAMNELKRRELAGGGYYTRIAAQVLCRGLGIGGVKSFNRKG